ncbi:hypothetical protein Asp14428_33140 [Actinoplanes sp. NBRC 14428]|nr:hypothetical protein Asp14428_33140 [Actinoplanes sp. NBRC 14428]
MDVPEILRLCSAVREALPMLDISPQAASDLLAFAAEAEMACRVTPPSPGAAQAAVKRIRHQLIESADGPLAAILADSAGRIIGDDIGKMFS